MQQSRSLVGWVDPRLEGLQRPAESGRTPGLCRAISHRTGFDVTLVRALFVLLTLSTGIGILLYGWGTVLSYGADGRRPIDSLLPSFTGWSLNTQATVVVTSTVLFGLSFGQMAPMSFIVAVVVLILLYAATSRARRSPMPPPPSAQASEADPLTAAERAHTVGEWRAAMQQATNRPVSPQEPTSLPVLDLYGPQPEPEAPEPKPRSSWGAAAVILLGGAATFLFSSLVTSWTPLSVTLGITAAVMGGLTLISALTVRGRKVPRLALGIVAATGLASVVLPMVNNGYYGGAEPEAVATMTDEDFAAADDLEGTHEIIHVASGGTQVVDLTAREPAPGEFVTFEIRASNTNLVLQLPLNPISSITNNGEWVEMPISDDYQGEFLPMSVDIYGENVDLTVLGGREPVTFDLPSGISLERDLTTYDLSGFSAEDPLLINITAADSTVDLKVPEGQAAVMQNGEAILGENGATPLVIQVSGDNVELTLEEIR
ncbi:MAG: PspC domain-containing protein [Tessaracoccus sp.]